MPKRSGRLFDMESVIEEERVHAFSGVGDRFGNAAKRLFDFTAAACGLAVLAPFFVILAAAVKLEDGGPVFFRGERVGRNGRLFRIVKFRSMVVNAALIGPSSTAEDDRRVTRIGRRMRKHKLDELPQLINVLMGDMSLVGPRPQVPWAVDLYTPEERRLLELRPGMTDFASIVFANEGELLKGAADPDRTYLELIHPEKMRLCLDYMKRRSFRLDLELIGRTVFGLAGAF